MSEIGKNPFEDFDLEDEATEAEMLANADLEITEDMIAAYSAGPQALTLEGIAVGRAMTVPGETKVSTRETLIRLLRAPMGHPVRVQLLVTPQGRDGERFVQAIHALMSRMRRHARKHAVTLEPFKLYVEYIAKTEDNVWEEVSLLRWDKPKPTSSSFDELIKQAENRPGLVLDINGPEAVTIPQITFDNPEESEEE